MGKYVIAKVLVLPIKVILLPMKEDAPKLMR